MGLKFPRYARAPRQKKPQGDITFKGFPHGLNTSVPPFQLAMTELAECINFKLNQGGQLETRRPVIVYSNSATASAAAVKSFGQYPIGGTMYEILVDANYKLDYLDVSLDPTNIGTLIGDAHLFAYNDVVIICDGSYLKYLDGVTANDLHLAYDDGTGTAGYQYNNSSGSDDSFLAVGNGTNFRVATAFTTQTWDSGFTIPSTTMSVKLSRVGNGYIGTDNVSIYLTIRVASNDDIVARGEISTAAGSISTTATEYSATMTNFSELDQNTAYYACVEYDNGDGSNYIKVHCTDVTSGGVGHHCTASTNTGSNMISNGGFDSDTTGWSTYNSTLASVAGGQSGNCLEVTDVSGGQQGARQTVTLKAGEYYKVTGYVKSGTSGDISYEFEAYDVDGGFERADYSGTTSGSWVQQSFSFIASSSNFWIACNENTTDPGNTTLFDEITLYLQDGTYVDDTDKNPIISVKPGRPPKAEFGTVFNGRPWIKDPDNPGVAWYGNLTYLDWSTADGGGYITVIDQLTNTFEIGGMDSVYGDLYFIGTKELPYLAKLDGSDPTDWSINLLFQKAETVHKTLVGTASDLWFAEETGVDNLLGVQEYGDVRTFSASDPVGDKIRDYFDGTTAIAGYYPKDGQYWLYMPSYGKILVAHTKLGITDPEERHTRYPWTEYILFSEVIQTVDSTLKWSASGSGTNEYYLTTIADGDPSKSDPDFLYYHPHGLMVEGTMGSLNDKEYDYGDNDTLGYSTIYVRDDDAYLGGDTRGWGTLFYCHVPTTFAAFDNKFFFGANDGLIYRMRDDERETQETAAYVAGIQCPVFKARTAYISLPFTFVNLIKNQVDAGSKTGADMSTYFYVDGNIKDHKHYFDFNIHADDFFQAFVTGQPAASGSMVHNYDPDSNPLYQDINMNARAFQIGINDIELTTGSGIYGEPLFINTIIVKYRVLEH